VSRQADGDGIADLCVRLLGPTRLLWRGREAQLSGRNARGLMALLVLRSRPYARETLAAELWPDADRRSATWLRQTIWLVRAAFTAVGADHLEVVQADNETVRLQAELTVDVDAARFRRLLRERPPLFEEAIGLYDGDFAEDLTLESVAWHRELLADMYEDALAAVASSRLAAGDIEGAREAAERLLARDHLREEAHSVLIEIQGLAGARSQVVRQYRHLRSILALELDETPLPETEAVYRTALARSTMRSANRVHRERLARVGDGTGGPPHGPDLPRPVLPALGRHGRSTKLLRRPT
jgi:DNA-binding SARP family transcriptional activator